MADSVIQQIRDKIDIVELVSGYLKLEKTGINFRSRCPFHSEKKPSFFVSPARQSFKCFGCGKGGDVFTFIKEIEGLEFGDALRLLAKRAGVEIRSLRPELRTKRQRLYEICELAGRFYQKQLGLSERGRQIQEYLKQRGLKEETIKKWRLGYAPSEQTGGWRPLSDFLVGRGYKREEVVEAGLAVQPEKQGQTPYDRFRGRIIFPVFDTYNQIIGFGGRVFEKSEEVAKYLNTPNTLLYDKSRVLYGLNFAKLDIRKNDCSILTEGYTDVILSHQAGFTNTVALSGTALTNEHLKILKRYSNNLLTGFDMDRAGNLATQRSVELARVSDFEVKIIEMPKDKDPADIILENPASWQKAVDNAQEIMAFYFNTALNNFDKNSAAGKKQIAGFLLPLIKRIPNQIVRSHWAQQLASLLNVSEEAVSRELVKMKDNSHLTFEPEKVSPSPLPPAPKSRRELLEEKMLSLILKKPQFLPELKSPVLAVCSTNIKIIFAGLKQGLAPQTAVEQLKSESRPAADILNQCLFQAEALAEDNIEEEFKLCLNQLGRLALKQELENLSSQIRLAEQQGDQEKLKELASLFNQLAQGQK